MDMAKLREEFQDVIPGRGFMTGSLTRSELSAQSRDGLDCIAGLLIEEFDELPEEFTRFCDWLNQSLMSEVLSGRLLEVIEGDEKDDVE